MVDSVAVSVTHTGKRETREDGTPHPNYNVTSELIGFVKSFQIKRNLGKKLGTFNIKLHNPKINGNSKFTDIFNYNDLLEIKFGRKNTTDGTFTETFQTSFKGFLQQWEQSVDTDRSLTLVGVDIGKKLFDTFFTGTANQNDDTSVSTVIINMIADRNQLLNTDIDSTNVTATTKTDYGFLRFENETLFDIIAKLSVNDFTGNGRYIFYVDQNFGLNWKAKPDTIEPQLIAGQNVISFNTSKSVLNTKNLIVIDAGQDFNGRSLLTFGIDQAAVDAYGGEFISTFQAQIDLAKKLKTENGIEPNNTFPFGDATLYTGGNAQFRADLRQRALEYAQLVLFPQFNTPEWESNVVIRGTHNYEVGNKVYLFVQNLGNAWNEKLNFLETDGVQYSGKKFIIDSITHRFSASDGWITELDLKIDVDVRVAGAR